MPRSQINLNQIKTSTSASLAAVISDETGTGALVFANTPTLVTPNIGAATASRLTLTGSISSTAWTTDGLRIGGIPGTLTDTTSTGNIPAAYSNAFGGNTIAASFTTTYLDYISAFFREPVAGTNVTFTRRTALGAESLRIGNSNHLTVSNTGVLTATNSVLAGKTQSDASFGAIATATDGATVTFDLNTSNKHTVTLGGNRTLAVSNPTNGQTFSITLVQDATGSRTVTWFAGITWPNAAVPALSTAPNTIDTFVIQCVGSGVFRGYPIAGLNIGTTRQVLTPTGTTQTIDWNGGGIVDLTLSSASGNVTLTLNNAVTAISYLITVNQGATARNLTFPVGTLQAGGGGVTYTGTANQKDIIAVLFNGVNYFISVSKNYS